MQNEKLKQMIEDIHVRKINRIASGTSSKGSQVRWFCNNKFIKLDLNGYESIAEFVTSNFLRCTDIEHVDYFLCNIIEDGKYLGIGCYSHNLLQHDEELILFSKILRKYSSNYMSMTVGEVRECILDSYNIDIRDFLNNVTRVDFMVKNEDRNYNNLALIRNRDKVRTCPLFDHGLSCMSDTFSYPLEEDFYDNLRRIKSKIFYSDFSMNIMTFSEPLSVDIPRFGKFCDSYIGICSEFDRAVTVIDESLSHMKGVIWKDVN